MYTIVQLKENNNTLRQFDVTCCYGDVVFGNDRVFSERFGSRLTHEQLSLEQTFLAVLQ